MEPPAAGPPASPNWLDPSELRVGLGCMRLSTDADREEQRAVETIAAAVDGGITVFDTARAYGLDETELGHNERLLARALGACNAPLARIVTKGGMTRPGGDWVPDGRARSLRADCEASLAALAGLPIDLYLLHASDPRVPWRTSVRALARVREDGLAARIGVANVNRAQLDEALELAPLAAVQVALSPFDDAALRGGVVERCLEAGLIVMAHSPLGGPRRAGRLAGNLRLERSRRPVERLRPRSRSPGCSIWMQRSSPSRARAARRPYGRRPQPRVSGSATTIVPHSQPAYRARGARASAPGAWRETARSC